MSNILSAKEFTPAYIESVFNAASSMKDMLSNDMMRRELLGRHIGKQVLTWFIEHTDHTRLGFESAAKRLGADVLSLEYVNGSSLATTEESIEDTVRVLEGYADLIVMSHHHSTVLRSAAGVMRKPLINAGNGHDEHPTQALIDYNEIFDTLGRFENLDIVIAGDLKGKTARSFALLAANMGRNKITAVSSPELRFDQDVRSYLSQRVHFSETRVLHEALRRKDIDVVYVAPLRERGFNTEAVANQEIGRQELRMLTGTDTVILDRIPRQERLLKTIELDGDIYPEHIFPTEANSLSIRMAILDRALAECDSGIESEIVNV